MNTENDSQNSGKLGRKGTFGFLLLVLLIITVWLGSLSKEFEEVKFASDAGDKSLTALGTLFIIALFVERAQEVYISAWRKLGREKIDADIAQLKEQIKNTQAADDKKKGKLKGLEGKLLEYRHGTRQIAFLGAMILGVLISLAGPRILAEVVVVHGDMGAWQVAVFNGMDILITGGLIGGGSEGIHKLVKLITDFLDATRAKTKNQEG